MCLSEKVLVETTSRRRDADERERKNIIDQGIIGSPHDPTALHVHEFVKLHDVGSPVGGDLLPNRVRRAQQGLPFLPGCQKLRAPRRRVRRAFEENVGKGSVGVGALCA